MRRLALACAALLALTVNPPLAVAERNEQQAVLELTRAAEISVGQTLEVDLELKNTGDAPIEDLQVTTRRGDPVASVTAARAELADGAYPYFGTIALGQVLEPGESRTLTLHVPTALGAPNTLAIEKPGAYPVMFTLTGTRDGVAHSFADERFILGVDIPSDHELTLIYPVTAKVDIVPGETGGEPLLLESEQLADQFAEGGRLDSLLDIYESHDQAGTCVALDPALVDAARRMAEGYKVSGTRPSIASKPQRLRDSWFQDDESPAEGTGSAAAAAWYERLKDLPCIMPMPWANTDINAVAETHNEWLLHEAVQRGFETISAIGTPVNLLVPEAGFVNHDFGVPVLVADNAGGGLGFDASLATLLAGAESLTPAYSNPALRYDLAYDSPVARNLSAAAGLRLAVAEKDTVAKLPNNLSPDTAQAILDAAEGMRRGGIDKLRGVEPANLNLASSVPAPEIAQVEQQAHYTDELTSIMVNDPAIALTRYGFTLPLRRDLLTALSLPEEERGRRLRANQHQLQELRASVSLIPPGNVYTRTSDSSPLLIVAENGLPLPVEAHMLYEGDAKLNTPSSLRIPAKGSITATMTADIPEGARRDIRLWLATPEGATISQPVVIAVQTRGGMLGVYSMGALLAVVALGALLIRRKK